MKIIKMIKGMTVINGKQFAVGDGAFQIDDEAKAARLVQLGVAEYADGDKVQTSIENTMAAATTASVIIDDLAGRNNNKSNVDLALGASGGDQ